MTSDLKQLNDYGTDENSLESLKFFVDSYQWTVLCVYLQKKIEDNWMELETPNTDPTFFRGKIAAFRELMQLKSVVNLHTRLNTPQAIQAGDD